MNIEGFIERAIRDAASAILSRWFAVIDDIGVYTIPHAAKITGMSQDSIEVEMRERRLTYWEVGDGPRPRRYVRGDDFRKWLTTYGVMVPMVVPMVVHKRRKRVA